jgi:catechol 2,3-dioxygenase-like lactoylglutathione lyase family enzyme
MAHVADVSRSIRFYEALGFRLRNTFAQAGETTPSWAWLESAGASLMVARATEPVDPAAQAVLFYIYCDGVEAARAACLAAGIEAGPIACPFYAPRGEFRVTDPDGYALMITHT